MVRKQGHKVLLCTLWPCFATPYISINGDDCLQSVLPAKVISIRYVHIIDYHTP